MMKLGQNKPGEWENWYVFKEIGPAGGFITPWSDPFEYEHSFDYQFASPEDAYQFCEEMEIDPEQEGWVLVKMNLSKLDVYQQPANRENVKEINAKNERAKLMYEQSQGDIPW